METKVAAADELELNGGLMLGSCSRIESCTRSMGASAVVFAQVWVCLQSYSATGMSPNKLGSIEDAATAAKTDKANVATIRITVMKK